MKLVLWFGLAIAWAGHAVAQTKETLGWVEKIRIFPGDVVLHAKLDTGADYSSLSARDIDEFAKEGKRWVRFSVVNRYGKETTLERPVQRYALIKRHNGKHQKRPVIRLGLCVGVSFMETDVNLVDRTNFEYQMLIGRSFLAGHAIVDAANTFTREPDCQKAPAS